MNKKKSIILGVGLFFVLSVFAQDRGERNPVPPRGRGRHVPRVVQKPWYFYIAPLTDRFFPRQYPHVFRMQKERGGQVALLQRVRGRLLARYADISQIPWILLRFGQPNLQRCALPTQNVYAPFSYPVRPPAYTGGKGKLKLPSGINESWNGYGKGGCGTWSTAMCNRIIGVTKTKKKVTKKEWNRIAKGIGQTAAGASSTTGRSKYYQGKGYCVEVKKFSGKKNAYQQMAQKMKQGCDIKLAFWKKTWRLIGGKVKKVYIHGHIETVLSVNPSKKSCTTNSWGKKATIKGGSSTQFRHSLDGTVFKTKKGKKLWPIYSTVVWSEYVCKCSTFQKLARWLGF